MPKNHFGASCVVKIHLSAVPETAFNIHEPSTSKRTLFLGASSSSFPLPERKLTSVIPVRTRIIPAPSSHPSISPRNIIPKRIENSILPISATQYMLSGNLFIELSAHIQAKKIEKDLKKITRCARQESAKTSCESGITKIKAKRV